MLYSVGVDWVTCTQIPELASDLVALGNRLIEGRAAGGWEVQDGGVGGHGYKGRSSEGVGLGARDSDVLLRLSGDLARENWREAVEAARNVSRIDLQVTYQLQQRDLGHGAAMFERFEDYRRKVEGGRPPSGSMVRRVPMGYTVYVGSRSSDVFGRLYDKGAEQATKDTRKARAQGEDLQEPEDCAGWVWRAEVEYKREYARAVARGLAGDQDATGAAGTLVHQFFAGRGMALPFSPGDPVEIRPEKVESDVERWLEWVRRSVAPGFRRAVELGRGKEALEAVLAELLGDGSVSLREVLLGEE